MDELFSEFESLEPFIEAVCFDKSRPEIPRDCPPTLKTLLQKAWHHHKEKRGTFEEACKMIDEVIVETVVKLPGARAFWKRHFIEETNELQQEVRFSKFANALAKALDTSTASISKVKDLITDDGNVTMASFDRSSRWFGEFYTANGGERLVDSMAIMAGEFNKAAGQNLLTAKVGSTATSRKMRLTSAC